MTNGTQERLPDPKTWDPRDHDAVPHREGDMSEGLQWKLDILIFGGGRIEEALVQIHDCIDVIKVLLGIIIALLFAIVVLAISILIVLNTISATLAAVLVLVTFIAALLAFFIVQVVVPFIIARNRSRRAATP